MPRDYEKTSECGGIEDMFVRHAVNKTSEKEISS